MTAYAKVAVTVELDPIVVLVLDAISKTLELLAVHDREEVLGEERVPVHPERPLYGLRFGIMTRRSADVAQKSCEPLGVFAMSTEDNVKRQMMMVRSCVIASNGVQQRLPRVRIGLWKPVADENDAIGLAKGFRGHVPEQLEVLGAALFRWTWRCDCQLVIRALERETGIVCDLRHGLAVTSSHLPEVRRSVS